jgi:hypothetical protein
MMITREKLEQILFGRLTTHCTLYDYIPKQMKKVIDDAITEIISELSTAELPVQGEAVVQCAWCKGLGKVGEPPMSCEMCAGSGKGIAPFCKATPTLKPSVNPIDVVLFCPKCCTQHIDAPEEPKPSKPSDSTGAMAAAYFGTPAERAVDNIFGGWTNPPHKSHLCHGCGHIWRPSDHPTNGVAATVSGKDADVKPSVNELVEKAAQDVYLAMSTGVPEPMEIVKIIRTIASHQSAKEEL